MANTPHEGLNLWMEIDRKLGATLGKRDQEKLQSLCLRLKQEADFLADLKPPLRMFHLLRGVRSILIEAAQLQEVALGVLDGVRAREIKSRRRKAKRRTGLNRPA
ncbi:MAG: hypothetical protein IT446_14800 [Phycisphaerales bacterium]|nr:hypothetical protein [Phycisphaerales bacterium]